MKITKVNIPKDDGPEGLGLDEIRMDHLGDIVILVGKNGSGKTRILNRIKTVLKEKPKTADIIGFHGLIDNTKKRILELEKEMELLKWEEGKGDAIRLSKIMNIKRDIKFQQDVIRDEENKLVWELIKTDSEYHAYPIIDFVPQSIAFSDPTSFTQKELVQIAGQTSSSIFDSYSEKIPAKVKLFQDRYYEAIHQNSTLDEDYKAKAKVDYNRIVKIFSDFLEMDLDRDYLLRTPIVQKLQLHEMSLSEGQSILLQLGFGLYDVESQISGSPSPLIFLDEPENHLHPNVIIEAFKKIREITPTSQIWIATHSIPLIAHFFNEASLWFVENGKISRGGNLSERVLKGLLGDEEEISKLHQFTGLPSELAAAKYAYECLLPPLVAKSGSEDRQINQIAKIIQELSGNDALVLLDFGAGRGRLVENLSALNIKPDQIKYVAYNKGTKPEFGEECKSAIQNFCGNKTKLKEMYYDSDSDLLRDYPKSFQVILMCNVFHEIPSKDWLNMFGENGLISSLLMENGKLLIVEDQVVPIGEKAHKNGFLVFDRDEFISLFNLDNFSVNTSSHENNERLKAHLIDGTKLVNITNESIKSALNGFKLRALKEVDKIRQKEIVDFKAGREHAFWSQQFVNATLELKEYEKE